MLSTSLRSRPSGRLCGHLYARLRGQPRLRPGTLTDPALAAPVSSDIGSDIGTGIDSSIDRGDIDRGGRDEGSTAVELAIVTPIVFMLVLLVAQFALFIHARQVVTAAAQQGMRSERLSTVGGGQGQSTSLAFAGRLGGKAVTGVSAHVDRSRDTVTVTVTGQGQSILPWMHLSVTGTSSGPVEQWTGDPR